MKYWMIVFCGLFSPIALLAQETAPIFNRIPATEKGVEELTRLLSDPNVRIEEKSNAVDRLGVLARQLYNSDFPPEKLYNPLLGALTPRSEEPYHHVLRIHICRALGNFWNLKGGQDVVPALGRRLQDFQEHEEVRIAAAQSLGKFRNQSDLASQELLTALDKEVERGPQADNVTVVTAVVQSLGALGDKRAFVPLMKIIKSRFPAGVKKEAQRSLESIRWD
jgi:HEAT repeat protein